MDVEHTRSLAFLFSLAALPMMGCPAGDDTTTNADSSSTGNDPSTSTSNSTTATTTTATTTTLSTTDDPTTESGTTDDTESSSTSTGSGSESSSSGEAPESSSDSTGAEVDPVCAMWIEHYIECYPPLGTEADELAAECVYGLTYYSGYSAACGMAFEELLTCLTAADCEDIMQETACTDEQMAMEDAGCTGNKGSSTSVGTN